MKILRSSILIVMMVSALLALAGCADSVVQFTPDQPSGYLKLIDKYEAGALYQKTSYVGYETTVIFDSGDVLIPSNGLKIYDCRVSTRYEVSLSSDKQYWCLNGTKGTVRYQPDLSNKEATAVYAYIDKYTLHMYISNGNVLDFLYDTTAFPPEPEKFEMPIVRITHKSDRVHQSYYIDADILIEDPDQHYSEVMMLKKTMQIKGRGNSTWEMPKKPYRLKLSEKAEVLGMPSNKDWCLLANYADKSLMRNKLAMEISRILGFSWTPRCVPVEVYMNGEYLGVYDLFEHKEVAKQKVNIDPEAGDFYLEIEQSIDEPHYFYTSMNVPIQFKDPEEPTTEQETMVKNYFSSFEKVLKGVNFKDPVVGYAAYIDVDSFVDNYIIEELAKDIDGNVRKSSFLTLENGGKLKFYHQWDFDLAFGNANYFPDGNNGPTGWWIKDYCTDSYKGDGWYQCLFKDPAFVRKVQNRWNEVYDRLVAAEDYIDLTVDEMGDAPARNFQKWDILSVHVWPNVKVTGSYKGEIEWLESFYYTRLLWLDTNINKL